MKLFVTNDCEGLRIDVTSLSVHSSLTFCTVDNNPLRQNKLLEYVKKGLVHSFEVRGSEIKIAFYTKHVQEIL
jgi:hypothetical protein